MDATAPGIISPFQVGKKRRHGARHICPSNLKQTNKQTRVSQKPDRFLPMSNWPGHCQKSPRAAENRLVFVFPGSGVETAKGRGVWGGCGVTHSMITGCSFTAVASP